MVDPDETVEVFENKMFLLFYVYDSNDDHVLPSINSLVTNNLLV